MTVQTLHRTRAQAERGGTAGAPLSMAAAEYAGASKRSIPLGQRRWPYRSRGHRARTLSDRDRAASDHRLGTIGWSAPEFRSLRTSSNSRISAHSGHRTSGPAAVSLRAGVGDNALAIGRSGRLQDGHSAEPAAKFRTGESRPKTRAVLKESGRHRARRNHDAGRPSRVQLRGS
jgi:hypothetical protein